MGPMLTAAYVFLMLVCLIALLGIGVKVYHWVKQTRVRAAINRGAVELASDLDAVRMKPYAFHLGGVIHVINPVSLERFIEIGEAQGRILELIKKKNVTHEEVIAAYQRLFSAACPTMTLEVVQKMNQAQLFALMNTVNEFMAGRAHMNAEKKSAKSRGSVKSA